MSSVNFKHLFFYYLAFLDIRYVRASPGFVATTDDWSNAYRVKLVSDVACEG
jgi:hypothetical protein